MDLVRARWLAYMLLAQHGLGDWKFEFDHARRRFGCCHISRKKITLSRPLTLLNDEPEVRDTLLHEIAHALEPTDGHGPRWRAACVRVGAKPVRCYTDKTVRSPARPPAKLVMTCEVCQWVVPRQRQPKRRAICRKCRTPVTIRAASGIPASSAVSVTPAK
jgi:predicted SprT family Zn-dependent metalloprotease